MTLRKQENFRYNLIDTIRGLAIVSMCFYHATWDLVYLFNVNLPWFYSGLGFLWQQSICFTFIILSGFCQYFARHSYRDGIIISLAGLLITFFSFVLPQSELIVYGILSFLGFAILFTAVFKFLLYKIPPTIGMILNLILFILFRPVNQGFLYFFREIPIPSELYPVDPGWLNAFIGFTPNNFTSGDYFSFLPWIFLFLFGFYLSGFFKKHHLMKYLKGGRIPVLSFLGRHSLIIYMIHQPLIFLFLNLCFSVA